MNPLIPHLLDGPGGHRGLLLCLVKRGVWVCVVPTAPGGLPGLGMMPRYAQADLLPDFKSPIRLQKEDFRD